MAEPADLLVVGAGPGGYVAAARAAQLGREVTLVERGGSEGGIGGSCLHVGCIPSKALIELADAFHRSTSSSQPGLTVSGANFDLVAFQGWKAEIVGTLAKGVEGLLDGRRVRRLAGELRFAGPSRAVVASAGEPARFIDFRQVIVATGSRPVFPPGLQPDGRRVLSSTDVLALSELPGSVAVVGAGYIGLELGTALAKLGVRVTVIEALDRILPGFDSDLTRPVQRRLEALGVELRLGSRVRAFEGEEVLLDEQEGEGRIEAERLLVAVGRRPNTDELGLEALGISLEPGGTIAVDDSMRASDTVAAIGDVTAGPALAHRASAQAIVAAEALCGLPAVFAPLSVPEVVFTDPELAAVGMTATQARAAGLEVDELKLPASANGRAATLAATDGLTKVVLERSNGRVAGVQIAGPHASELAAGAGLAVEMMATAEDVLATIHPHPTLSEGMHSALEPARRTPVG